MKIQVQKMSVVENGKYIILFRTDVNSLSQVYCSVAENGDVRFDGTDIPQSFLQSLSNSSAWKQAIHSFHEVSAKSYYLIGEYQPIPPWGVIPIRLQEIEVKNDDECELQFEEPDRSLKVIQVKLTTMNTGSESIHGFDLTGDKTALTRIWAPRDMYRVTKDFLDAAHEI